MIINEKQKIRSKFENSESKRRARVENVKIYQKFSGLDSIPSDREYWTLSEYQPPNKSEIDQLVQLGFLVKSQFHGIDRDKDKIDQNILWHPEAHWHHGDWARVINKANCDDNFNPAFIYLDTTSLADYDIAAEMVGETMLLCPKQTLLLANVMLNDPHTGRKFDKFGLLKNLVKKVPSLEIENWVQEVPNFEYNSTGKTNMQTYAFFKAS